MTIFENRMETLREETPTVKANRRHDGDQNGKISSARPPKTQPTAGGGEEFCRKDSFALGGLALRITVAARLAASEISFKSGISAGFVAWRSSSRSA
jgi:hypothetical protein